MLIPPFKLQPVPLNDEAKLLPGFKWADDAIGKRHQLGGTPQWLQDDMTPTCKECGKPMTFYAQLDSINDDICIADCGMIYVFVCLECNETLSLIQSY
jgi:predicted nucleic acid-binding Zn ribbon protein